jgi:hypothetical protein
MSLSWLYLKLCVILPTPVLDKTAKGKTPDNAEKFFLFGPPTSYFGLEDKSCRGVLRKKVLLIHGSRFTRIYSCRLYLAEFAHDAGRVPVVSLNILEDSNVRVTDAGGAP